MENQANQTAQTTERNQFTFYKSFYEAVKMIKDDSARVKAFEILCDYALYGVEPEDLTALPDSVAIVFMLSKPNIDASRERAECGKRGGKARRKDSDNSDSGDNGAGNNENSANEQEMSDSEQNCTMRNSNAENCEAHDDKAVKKDDKTVTSTKNADEIAKRERDRDRDRVRDREYTPPKSPQGESVRGKRFVKPTIEEIGRYCKEKGHNLVNPTEFFNYYESQGWHVGKNPMTSWHSAVALWQEKRKNERPYNVIPARTQTENRFANYV